MCIWRQKLCNTKTGIRPLLYGQMKLDISVESETSAVKSTLLGKKCQRSGHIAWIAIKKVMRWEAPKKCYFNSGIFQTKYATHPQDF